MKGIKQYLESFISLFYPKICLTCDSTLVGNENVICTSCMHSLPETGFHSSANHPVADLFSGRLRLEYAHSLLFFDKGSKYRKLIYQLKYQGRKEAGIFLGKLIGSRIKEGKMNLSDCIIPVPLHKSRMRRRGFNQSAILAQGISSVLGIPVFENALVRKEATTTQTRKGRFERWQNVEGSFECKSASLLENKQVLLIDDVVTTGATLEAAGNCILEIKGTSISIATAAYTLS